MSDRRQKNQLELAFPAESRSEAPTAAGEGTESLAAKRGTVRFAELTQRGVNRDLAARTAGSNHGPWRLAESPGLHFALPDAYFASLGIPQLFGQHVSS